MNHDPGRVAPIALLVEFLKPEWLAKCARHCLEHETIAAT